MSAPLHILAAGMVTAVGHDGASSAAAIRARLDGFQETRFLGPGGEWLIGAPVSLPCERIGNERLAYLAACAVADILRKVPEARANCALILCLAEEGRPGRPIRDNAAFARMVAEAADLPPDLKVQVLAHGRPSGMLALAHARHLIAQGQAVHVLILGVDSYLTTLSIAHYSAEKRLLAPGNANGFIPGEAAAAILCSTTGVMRLTGLGLAREEAYIYNRLDDEGLDRPLRGDGMTKAYRAALTEAGMELGRVEYRISDLIGEQYWFRQTSLALIRLARGRSAFQDLQSPAESVGNIGAAVVPIMLGMALAAAEKGYAPGSPVLIEASSDDGACGVAVLHEVRP